VVARTLKSIIEKSLHIVGLEVRRQRASSHVEYMRNSLAGVLSHARNIGLAPATVLDVGAAYGAFALSCQSIFPNARYLLIDPLVEYETYLQNVVAIMAKAEYVLCAATASSGQVTINVHPDLVGSSMCLEREESDVNGVPRTVPAETIDRLCEDRGTSGPYLIKVDVQGAELDVLSGATKVLEETEYLIVEASLFEFFEGGSQFYDVIHYMKLRGFVVYDVFGLQFRPLDNAISQVDLAFVRDDSQFRKYHIYATPKQREEQTKRLLRLQERGRL